ncbi:hypothetical protein UFOVP178_49 [uncultured Caudovirales phage]|jgi:hypothetical protein|uniref:Uncharacterized protein n=1 Tax=uncultured Caudovirales phage TaxID=2100421 RepID=A0A6J7WBN1_9CAUD|nr:hypothetical protein UFOVP178_49 [uncultured Caudovirales phage]
MHLHVARFNTSLSGKMLIRDTDLVCLPAFVTHEQNESAKGRVPEA